MSATNTFTLYQKIAEQPMTTKALCECTGWTGRVVRSALEQLLEQGLAKRIANAPGGGFVYGADQSRAS